MNPVVSVIVPVYNNERYVVPCMRSLLAQTLENIEIICINDGSTDCSSAVLHSFADSDSRVVVVDKENEGYGVGINTGLRLARGKYVTILESDDFADLDMLETLVAYAEAFNLDVAKANFSLYWSKKIKKDHFLELFAQHECDRVIDPSNRDDQHCFYVQPAIWSAVYRSDFIRDNNLWLLETPGAAYQDTAFNFKIWACAKRVMFIHRPFVHYRQDNESSSINSPGKVNNICLEYAEIRRWLREERPELHDSLAPVATKMMCDAYKWNTGRIAEEFRLDFVKRFGEEFAEAERNNEVDPSLFAPGQLAEARLTVMNPQGFIDFVTKGKDPERGIRRLVRKASTLAQVSKLYGTESARNLVMDKIRRKSCEPTPVDVMDTELSSRKEPKFLEEVPEPMITVVLTVYNTAEVLRDTLDSIFAQTYTAFNLICVNDGSTDSSLEILEEYAARDCRVSIINQENQGVASARNRGLKEVSTPYTLILDSDDVFNSEFFEKLLLKAQEDSSDLVICSSCELDSETLENIPAPWALKLDKLPSISPFSPDDAADSLFEAIMGWPWDRLYRTSFVRDSGLQFPETLRNSEDGVFVYGLLARAKKISVIEDVLIKHRLTRKNSISNSRDKAPEDFYKAIVMLKKALQSIQELYPKIEKSFLNWAADYAIWNISTLTDSEAKQALVKRLKDGEYSELELTDHPKEYFDLYENPISERLNNL